jgi:MFS family permease
MSHALSRETAEYHYGIRNNFAQFSHQLVQVFFVGLTIGMFRTVVPALAETEFGVAKGSFMMLMAFVTAFGFVKGTLNFVAGRMSERIGRKKVLFLGWLAAVPMPFMIMYAPSWNWIVAATVLLGVNQGLTWSMTQTSKLDLTTAEQRGLTIGLNEFSGYFGVAVAGIITGYLATAYGPREGLMLFGLVVVGAAGLLTLLWVKDTLPWAHAEGRKHAAGLMSGPKPRYPTNIPDRPGTWEVFTLMSWRDARMASISQAGLYGFVWGVSQFFTGHLSDHVGRKKPIVWGMWLCGAGVALVLLGEGELWWSFSAAVMGFGMALLYPTLSAAVSDIAHPNWRGSAIGIYRFWRDLGYGIGALLLGAVAALFGGIEAGFWFTAAAMFASGLVVLMACEETHPRLNPGH